MVDTNGHGSLAEGDYSDALRELLEPKVVQASDSLWIYHNLVGMVCRKVQGEEIRAVRAFERSPSSTRTEQIPFIITLIY